VKNDKKITNDIKTHNDKAIKITSETTEQELIKIITINEMDTEDTIMLQKYENTKHL
jgi:hypothetical protein